MITSHSYIDDNKTQLILKGTLVKDVDIEKLGDVILRSCANSAFFEISLESIRFELYDMEDEYIGKVIAKTHYIKQYQSCKSDFKDFYLLLMFLASETDENLTDNITTNPDYIYLKSISVYYFDDISLISHAFRDKDPQYNQRIKSELRPLLRRLAHYYDFIKLYEDISTDKYFYTHIKMVYSQFEKAVKHLISGGMLTPTLQSDFKVIELLTLNFSSFAKLVKGDISQADYLKQYLKTTIIPSSVSVNDPCPCGSGKNIKNVVDNLIIHKHSAIIVKKANEIVCFFYKSSS